MVLSQQDLNARRARASEQTTPAVPVVAPETAVAVAAGAAPRSAVTGAPADTLGGVLARTVTSRDGARFGGDPGAVSVGRISAGPVLQRRDVIVQAGYMTGDMFGIAAALALGDFGVLILKEDPHGGREERSALLKAFYEATLRETGVGAAEIRRRVKLLEVGDAQTEFKSLTAKIKPADPGWTAHLQQLDKFKHLAGLDPRDRFQSPGHATWKVGDAFGAAPRASLEKVRKAWATKVVGPSEDQLKEYLKDKGIVPEKKYALLWVRLSAKRRSGGAHPELDTSVQGVRDLKAALKEGGRDVIIVGDRPNKTDVLEDAIDMVEFWNDDAFKAFTGLQGRLAQLRLFDYMVRKGYDVVSIGMRSGAMEGPALLGMPTVYIEEQGNLQHERMEKWLSKVPGWTQAQVAALPTRTGRRTQQPDRTATFPVLDKRQRDAVGAVSRELRKAYEWTRTELIAAYDPDETAFKTAFAKAVGQRVCQRLGERLDEWHRAYDAWAEAWWELDTHEKAVAALTGLPVETVRDKLRTLRGTATSVHKGLADFVREALASLGVEHTKELAAALATWRSQYSGKVSLSKGFDPEDVTLILQASASAVTQARFARVKREQAVLLGEIDELTRMRAGAAATYVDRNVTAKPAADEFRGGWLSFAVNGLKQKLALGPTTPLAEVQNRFKLFIREGDGQTWNQLLTAKLSTLHGLLYPA